MAIRLANKRLERAGTTAGASYDALSASSTLLQRAALRVAGEEEPRWALHRASPDS